VDIRGLSHNDQMKLEDHRALVRRGALIASFVLVAAVAAQPILEADFNGIPFLIFGLFNGALGASLLVRLIWTRQATLD
jgi:hypothetical protein